MPVTFFGRTVAFPSAPARLAIGAGADLVPLFVARERSGRYHITWQAPVEVPPLGPRAERIRAATQVFAARLEEQVRRDPTQWVHFYPFFSAAV